MTQTAAMAPTFDFLLSMGCVFPFFFFFKVFRDVLIFLKTIIFLTEITLFGRNL